MICRGAAFAADPVPDLKAGLLGRSYPVGAQVTGAAGIGVPLWGDTTRWKYGYARLALNGATSVVVNRIGVEAQVFPVSILGFSAGYDLGVRHFRPRFIDCAVLECEGRVDRAFVRSQLFFALAGVMLNLNVRYEGLHSYGSGRPFFDELTLLRGRNSGEALLQYNPVLLYSLNDAWRVGGISFYTRALDSGGYSHLYGPLAVWSGPDRLSVAGGIGMNESVVVHPAVTVFFTVQMMIEPSLGVADLRLRKRSYSSLF